MMIAHVITRLAMGGAQQMVLDLARQAHGTPGVQVMILTGVSGSDSLSAKNNKILEQVYEAGIPVAVCPFLKDRISPVNDARALWWLARRLRELAPSVVHIHSSKTGVLARLACRAVGLKGVIYHVHGWSFSRSTGAGRALSVALERALYHLTARLIFVCRDDLLEFVRLGGSHGALTRGTVIYPAATFLSETDRVRHRAELRASLGYADSDFVVGSIGRLDYQKNPAAFVAIAERYAEVDPGVKFLWVGDGDDRAAVERLVTDAGLTNRFNFPGYVADAEPYFAVFDTFVLTSRYEGLPVTVVKALACGTPVVGFLVNGMKDLDGMFTAMFGVPPGETDAFVAALASARRLRETGAETLQSEATVAKHVFDRDVMYAAITAVYAGVAREARAGRGDVLISGEATDRGAAAARGGSDRL